MKNTFYVNTNSDNIKTLSTDINGIVRWKKVTALTKHLPMNKDGTSDLVRITTRSGRTLSATKAKSFLVIKNYKIIPVRGDDLQIGDYVPVINNNINILDSEYKLDMNNFDNNFSLKLNDVFYDEITVIELVKPMNNFVYDLTVEDDKTFAVSNGILCYDTFHHAGVGAMGTTTLGVPRMNELLSFSKNMKTPVMIIHLEEEFKKNKEMAEKIASSIKYTSIEDIRKRVDIYYDPFPTNKDSFMEKDNVYNVFNVHNPSKYSCQSDFQNLPWLMRIELDREKLMEKEITLLDIKSKFCNFWERRYIDSKGMKKEDKALLEKVTQCSILSNNDNDRIPIIHIRFDMKDFDYGTVKGFLDNFIEKFKLKGMDGIEKITGVSDERVISFDNEDESFEIDKRYLIYTAGVNMTNIRYVNGVNLNKTTCNDIVEIYDKFGIEAARLALLKEIKFVFDTAGNSVNYQHISILVDIMTNNGTLISIDRHGLNRLDTDPLSRASFEKTVDQFITAAVFGEVDTMKSVSSRIMAGLVIKGGTGLCNVILDTKLIENAEYEDMEHKYQKTFSEISEDSVMNDVLRKEQANIFIPE